MNWNHVWELFKINLLYAILKQQLTYKTSGRKEKGYKAHKAAGGQSDRKRIRKSRRTCRDLRFDFERLHP